MHADIRAAELKRIAIARTAAMAADQTTTDAYAQVPESFFDAERHNRLRCIVSETAGVNGITAKLVGRIKDAAGGWSAWQDAAGANTTAAIAASGAAVLYPDEIVFDQYAVEVKATVGGSQGDANVKGKSFHLDT